MVLPLSRLGVCGGSALAGTVAGMVTTQNTPKPTTAAITARIDQLAQHRRLLRQLILRNAPRPKSVRAARPWNSPPCNFIPAVRIAGYGPGLRCRLLAVGVVAAAAILADLGHRRFEAVEILYVGLRSLGVGAELDAAWRRNPSCSPKSPAAHAVSPALELSGKRILQPCRCGLRSSPALSSPCEIERLLAFDHLAGDTRPDCRSPSSAPYGRQSGRSGRPRQSHRARQPRRRARYVSS